MTELTPDDQKDLLHDAEAGVVAYQGEGVTPRVDWLPVQVDERLEVFVVAGPLRQDVREVEAVVVVFLRF